MSMGRLCWDCRNDVYGRWQLIAVHEPRKHHLLYPSGRSCFRVRVRQKKKKTFFRNRVGILQTNDKKVDILSWNVALIEGC